MRKYNLNITTKHGSYPVIIGKNILSNISVLLKKNNITFEKCLIVYDSNVPVKFLKILKKKLKNKKIYIFRVKSSEKVKNMSSINNIISFMLKEKFLRTDLIISFGGGIISDISGFAASVYKRGINFVNIPTTLLSQVDASIGGKTGVNSIHGKNLIGSFYQPMLVLSDINFLNSLPIRELICGYSEILKHSLIRNKKFFLFLNKNIKKLLSIDSKFIIRGVYESCRIKKKIVEKDPLEKNLRKILNYGHTFGHAFEANMGYSKKLNHGEAVLLGMYCANNFAYKKNIIKKKDFELINKHFSYLKISNKFNKIIKKKDIPRIVNYMKSDKKNFNNKINLILLSKIGISKIKNSYKTNDIKYFLKNLLING
tara:strand:+ start:406 stop:1515 length:1110 start_codon:yes stop_codon:yes gene_type:complete